MKTTPPIFRIYSQITGYLYCDEYVMCNNGITVHEPLNYDGTKHDKIKSRIFISIPYIIQDQYEDNGEIIDLP